MFIPIIRRVGVAFDHEIADLADGNFAPVVVDNLGFERRRHLAAAAGFGSPRAIGQKVMGGFGRADHIQELQTGAFFPLVKERRRQGFAGR